MTAPSVAVGPAACAYPPVTLERRSDILGQAERLAVDVPSGDDDTLEQTRYRDCIPGLLGRLLRAPCLDLRGCKSQVSEASAYRSCPFTRPLGTRSSRASMCLLSVPCRQKVAGPTAHRGQSSSRFCTGRW